MQSFQNKLIARLKKLSGTGKHRFAKWTNNESHKVLRIESLENRWLLTTFTVNTTIDENDGVGIGGVSLRDAIFAANSAGGDTINFSPGLNGLTIELNSSNGEIAFAKSLTIDGGTLGITIDAGTILADPTPGTFDGQGIRIFNITDTTGGTAPPIVTMIGLTLTGADVFGNGGAIQSAGILTLQKMVIEGNGASNGGGVYLAVTAGGSENRQVLTIEDSILQNNTATANGGYLYPFNADGTESRVGGATLPNSTKTWMFVAR